MPVGAIPCGCPYKMGDHKGLPLHKMGDHKGRPYILILTSPLINFGNKVYCIFSRVATGFSKGGVAPGLSR